MTTETPDPPMQTKRPRLFTVITLTQERWTLGQPEPGVDTQNVNATTVVDIFQNDDNSVDVFCLPKPESDLVKSQGDIGIVFHLPPNLILRMVTLAQREVWEAMRRDLNDHQVAQIAGQWLDLPSDMVFEHIQIAREELEAGEPEPEEPEPEETAPPNGGASAPV